MMKGLIILMSVLNAVAFAAKFRKFQWRWWVWYVEKQRLITVKQSALNQRKCRHSDSACFVNLANEIILKGKQGYPELGLPVFDPLKIEKMNIEQGGAGPVNLKIQLRNFDLRGLSNVRFHKIDGFPERFEKAKMEFRFLYPVMHIQGPYKLEGRVLVLPVQGDGIANLTFCKIAWNRRRKNLYSSNGFQTTTRQRLSYWRRRSPEMEKATCTLKNQNSTSRRQGEFAQEIFSLSYNISLR